MNNPLLRSNPEIPVNSSGPNIEKEGGGQDLIVGQSNQESNRIRFGILLKKIVDNKTVKEKITTGNNGIFDWVIPTGSGYSFAPSISTLTYKAEN
jgi:hypothetical protein